MKQYFVYDAVWFEHDQFDTLEESKKYLTDLIEESQDEGIDLDHEASFISKVSHTVQLNEADSKENYPCCLGDRTHCSPDMDCPEGCEGEEWPYSDDFDTALEIEIKDLEGTKEDCK